MLIHKYNTRLKQETYYTSFYLTILVMRHTPRAAKLVALGGDLHGKREAPFCRNVEHQYTQK